ncbi:MAG: SCP2 sterol-binding domain-containing protein [Clostridia bacterium]|nr:SCP2 sterol-binding domain-containing protein [Clostridia bacterium]
MTFLEKFEELKSICNGADIKFDRDFAVQINMTDENCGGTYYIEHRAGVLNVEPYDYHDNNAVMTATSDILEKMLTGKIDSVAAFFEGKFTIDGDVEAVLQLTKISDAVKAMRKAEEKAKKEAEKAAKEAKKAEEKAKKEAEKKAKAEAEKKAKAEAEKKAKAEAKAEAEKKAAEEAKKAEAKKAPVKKTAAKKTAEKAEKKPAAKKSAAKKADKQMKLDI